MALIDGFSYIRQNTPDNFTLSNTTNFGSPELLRTNFGIYLIVAKVDVNAVESFLSSITSTPYASKVDYDISNSSDGHYHAEFLRFSNYSAIVAYHQTIVNGSGVVTTYPSLIYYPTTGFFYKNTLSVTGTAPDGVNGTLYWEKITIFTDTIVRLNTTIDIGVFDFVHDVRSSICTKNLI